jgi:hypothetical protein
VDAWPEDVFNVIVERECEATQEALDETWIGCPSVEYDEITTYTYTMTVSWSNYHANPFDDLC